MSELPDPWPASSMIWTAVFAIILFISIIGNCGVLWIILGILIHFSIDDPTLIFIRYFSPSSNVDSDQLFSPFSHHLRPPYLHHQLHPLLHLHERQGLDLRGPLLQNQQLRVLHDRLLQRVHPAGHQQRQEISERGGSFCLCILSKICWLSPTMTTGCHPAHWLHQEEGEMLKVLFEMRFSYLSKFVFINLTLFPYSWMST